MFDSVLLLNQTYSWESLWVSASYNVPELGLSLRVDALSYLFILLVTIIGFGTNIYILNYFKHEANEDSFTLLINWFVLSMIILVLANNLFTLFLGWELIGITSFFLINFWHERRGTLKSAFKAFIFNKVSDFFLFVFVVLIWFLSGESNLSVINLTLKNVVDTSDVMWVLCGLSLLSCSAIKSAQLIGHLWLPDSMEAPVPASALIHSATLVSAGLYLLLRFNVLLLLLEFTDYILILGSITAAYGGIVASAQTDVKKLLAYSTISHCGFLFVCAALGNTYLVIIYLFLHGLFKALTFFCVGSFIRVSGSQDTRQMGVLSRYLPVDTIFLILCAGNLGGLPFTLGYLYKNFFMCFLTQSISNFFVVGLCFIGMLTSLIYVYRLVYYCAFDINKGSLNLSLKQLQSNINLDKNYWSATTVIQCLAIYVLLGYSIYIYVLFYNYSLASVLSLDHFPLFFVESGSASKSLEQTYLFYLNYFYTLYILTISIICVVECRRSYTWVRKLYFLVFLVLFTFILVFIVL